MKDKASRRGFLKVLAAAPVAAPAVAKSTSAVLMNEHSMLPAAALQPYNGLASASGNAAMLQDEIKHIIKQKKRISIDESPRSDAAASIGVQVDALRSVSPVNRILMARRLVDEYRKNSELSWLDRRMAELKEQLGVLGVFMDLGAAE